MAKRIVITEDQLRQYVRENINEKIDDVVYDVNKDSDGNITDFRAKTHKKNGQPVTKADIDKWDDLARKKHEERAENNKPATKRDIGAAKKAAKVKKQQRNQLLLPFGDEEKCSNRCKETNK